MSSVEGKEWIRAHVTALADDGPLHVLDIGPGVGTYAKLLRGPAVDRVTGIEVHAPYVETYRLREYYDEIVVADARRASFPDCDVVILGDVAEHMTEPEALAVWDKAAHAARRAVFLSIPVVPYPQGEIEGNHHETHVVDDWDHDKVMAAFPGIGTWEVGAEVGVYERRTDVVGASGPAGDDRP